MLEEYAVDPQGLGRLGPMWMLMEQFGVSKGRVLVDFPKRWTRLVHDAAKEANCPTMEMKSIEERLKRLKLAFASTSSGREYVGDPWLDAAIKAHAKQKFRAIICEATENSSDAFLNPLDATDDHPLWRATIACAIQRTPMEIAACASALGRISKELIFVDPYINDEPKYMRSFLAVLLASGADDRTFRKIEFHVTSKCGRLELFEASVRKKVFRQIGRPQEIHLFQWERLEGGDNMHARYFLTERGGMRFDYGLAEGNPGETTDVHLLTDELYRARRKDYEPTSAAFKLLGHRIVQ
jgi:hypothetical protein